MMGKKVTFRRRLICPQLTGSQGLGPVVASLSLGSAATMSFRPKGVRHEPNQPYNVGHQAAKKRAPVPAASLSITLSHGVRPAGSLSLIVLAGHCHHAR